MSPSRESECPMAATGRRSRAGTPAPPGAPQRCLSLDYAEGSAGTGRGRWGNRDGGGPGGQTGRREILPGEAGTEQGRDQGSVPSRCSTGVLTSPGVEGTGREKPGCWRGPPGWLLVASAGVQRRRQDEDPPHPLNTGEREIPGTPPDCVPPQEETSRGPGRGGRKTKRG